MKKIPNIHPGEILFEEFLKPMNISAYRLAKSTLLAPTRISQIIHRKRSISVDTALRLAKFFDNSAEFWLGIQQEYDIRREKKQLKSKLNRIKNYKEFVKK
jgi:antitoxin HigA-1